MSNVECRNRERRKKKEERRKKKEERRKKKEERRKKKEERGRFEIVQCPLSKLKAPIVDEPARP